MAFGVDVVGIAIMNIEVIGFDAENHGDMRGLCEIPKLETAHFVDDGVGGV